MTLVVRIGQLSVSRITGCVLTEGTKTADLFPKDIKDIAIRVVATSALVELIT